MRILHSRCNDIKLTENVWIKNKITCWLVIIWTKLEKVEKNLLKLELEWETTVLELIKCIDVLMQRLIYDSMQHGSNGCALTCHQGKKRN